MKVLFVGEAIYSSTHVYKGWNEFHLGKYEEHGWKFINSLTDNGIEVDYIPTIKVQGIFLDYRRLRQYDAKALSVLSSDSFSFHKEMSRRNARQTGPS
jgi:uncharacterized membrane protein